MRINGISIGTQIAFWYVNNINSLIMNHFNICPSCIHINSCVLTAQKDKVWSCSEFDDIELNKEDLQPSLKQERILELV